MLLACDYEEDCKEKVELLTAPWAKPGTVIQIEGAEYTGEKPAKIDIDKFCKIEYRVSGKKLHNRRKECNGCWKTCNNKQG